MTLAHQTVLITGGAQGIGRACVQQCLQEGAQVIFIDSDAEQGQAALAACDPTRTHFVHGDVCARSTIERALAESTSRFGGLDALINNAGITHAADFLDLNETDFDRVLAINLKSYFVIGQAVARTMVAAQRAGTIIHMSSVNAQLAIANQVPYCVSKGGINQLTRVMAVALAPHGIRVNAIGPGTIATDLARQAVLSAPEAERTILSRTPLGRLGEPEEIARIATFLMSPAASYITGQTLYADGGRTALNYVMPARE